MSNSLSSLERLPADEGTAEREKRLVNIGATFVADRETTEAIEPRQGPLAAHAVVGHKR